MAKGYWVCRVDVTDREKYKAYHDVAQPIVDNYGAKVICRGGSNFPDVGCVVVEGEESQVTAVFEFDSYQKAYDCYHSSDYQDALKIQDGAAIRQIIIIESV